MIRPATLLLVILLPFHFINGQQWLDLPIDFTAINQPLGEALLQLSEAAAVGISFDADLRATDQLVNIDVREQALRQILESCLSGTDLAYKTTANGIQVYQLGRDQFTISGYVEDVFSGERLVLASVWCPRNGRGVSTNSYGFFSLNLPPGTHEIEVSYLGYQADRQTIRLYKDQSIKVHLEPSLTLAEVLVLDQDTAAQLLFPSSTAGQLIHSRHLRNTPTLGGEADLIRTIQRQAGVQSGADGLGGMFVRGGSPDQNLILLDDVPIFQPSHSLGLFSVINPQIIRSARFEKGSFSARYGGRLSSVLDTRSKEGNTHQTNTEIEVGTFASKLLIETPLKENKSALLIAARRTHLDPWIASISRKKKDLNFETGETGYHFYDLNLKFHTTVSARDRIFLSAYHGNDLYRNRTESEFDFLDENNQEVFLFDSLFQELVWSNTATALRWNHEFSNKLFANTTFTYSQFSYRSENSWLQEESTAVDLYRYIDFFSFRSVISDYRFKTDFDYYLGNHQLQLGADLLYRNFQPGALNGFVQGDAATFDDLTTEIEEWFSLSAFQANEFSVYVQDQYQWSEEWKLDAGIRLVGYVNDGYQHLSLQPRLKLTHQLAQAQAFFIGLGRTAQYLHLLTYSGAGLPTDLWVPATAERGGQLAWLAEVGWQMKAQDKHPDVGISLYYKTMNGLLTYLDEAQLPTLQEGTADYWEDQVTEGKGWSYGLELQAQKNWGALSAQINYTYQQSKRQFATINNGEAFRYTFERPHKFVFDLHCQLSAHWTFMAGWEYSSGRPITLLQSDSPFDPLSNFAIPFTEQLSEWNTYELPDYHRLDFSFQYEITKPKADHTISLGLYNVYNRRNIFYTYEYVDESFPEDDGQRDQESLPLLPTFSYRLRL